MLQFLQTQIQSITSVLVRSSSALTPVILTLVAGMSNAPSALAQTAPSSGQPAIELSSAAQLADGVYFYGESPERDRIGQAYMIFEARQQKLVGAFYMPHSSFDCFYGQVTPNQLAVNVINSYDKTAHPYQVALEPVAIANSTTSGFNIQPQGFHPIQAIGDTEQEILETCRQDLHDRVW